MKKVILISILVLVASALFFVAQNTNAAEFANYCSADFLGQFFHNNQAVTAQNNDLLNAMIICQKESGGDTGAVNTSQRCPPPNGDPTVIGLFQINLKTWCRAGADSTEYSQCENRAVCDVNQDIENPPSSCQILDEGKYNQCIAEWSPADGNINKAIDVADCSPNSFTSKAENCGWSRWTTNIYLGNYGVNTCNPNPCLPTHQCVVSGGGATQCIRNPNFKVTTNDAGECTLGTNEGCDADEVCASYDGVYTYCASGGSGGSVIYIPPTQQEDVAGSPIELGPIYCNVDWPRIPSPEGGFDLNDYCQEGAEVTIGAIVNGIFSGAIWLGGIMAFGALFYSGFLYIFSGNAPANRSKAKSMLTNIAWGIGILLLSVVTLNLINPDIAGLKFANQRIVETCSPQKLQQCEDDGISPCNCIPVPSLPGSTTYEPYTNQYKCVWNSDQSKCVTDASSCEPGFGGVDPEDDELEVSCEKSGATSAQACDALTQDALSKGGLQCIEGGYNPGDDEEEEEEKEINGEFYCAPRDGRTDDPNLECVYDKDLNDSGFDEWLNGTSDTADHCNPGYKVPDNAPGKCIDETSNNGTRGNACWSVSFPCVPN